jgi:signal transduction histidine kinase
MKRRNFPVLGVTLVALIILLGLSRELFSPGPPRYGMGRPIALVIGVVLDLVVLVVVGRWMERRGWPALRAAAVTIPANVLLGVAYVLAVLSLSNGGIGADPSLTVGVAAWAGVQWSLELYALWVLGFRYPEVLRTEQLRALETARLRDEAELVQLRAHLQPHFLRNTLNAVAALVTEDPRGARRMLATLGDLLSESFQSSDATRTLEEEFAWLRRYAGILEERHHGALRFVWELDPRVRTIRVPVLIFQPLVENAVLHGALTRDGDGEVAVRAGPRDEGGVVITVEDNGQRPAGDPSGSRGLGLHLVRRRLELECPGSSFRLEASAAGRRAVVELP